MIVGALALALALALVGEVTPASPLETDAAAGTGEAWEVLERSRWDKHTQRIDATYLHVRVGSTEAIEGVLRQRYVLADQLRAALVEAGFSAIEIHGGFDGRDYDEDAELLVARARIAV